MCGTAHPDCGCDEATKSQHRNDHPEEYNADGSVKTQAPALVASAAVTKKSLPEEIAAWLANFGERAVLVAAGTDPETGLPTTAHAILLVEGLQTSDGRAIAVNATDSRQLPLPLFAQFTNTDHDDAALVGQITAITQDTTLLQGFQCIIGEITFDLGSPAGQEAARLCAAQMLRWGSVDLEILDSQYVEMLVDSGDPVSDYDDVSYEIVSYLEVTACRIAGWTMIGIPAFPQCVITPSDVALDPPAPMGNMTPMIAQGLVASAVDIPTTPPAAWFNDPQLAGPTPLVITSDGRVYGHLATWGTCHTGITNACVRPPHSDTDYAYFRTGRIQTTVGEARVGQITFNTGHAEPSETWQATASHYDNTGAAAADVAVGEDEHGIWVAGAMRPGVTDEQIRIVRASPLSGDWRKIGGSLQLVAALSVNVPGFPIVASAAMHHNAKTGKEEQLSLVAGGVRQVDPLKKLEGEFARFRQSMAPLMQLAAEQLSKRVNPEPKPTNEAKIIQLRERMNAG